MRGPKPVPTALKILRGNPGKRAINKREPRPATGRLVCPDHLGVDARREWKRIVRVLPRGMVTTVDLGVLANYCEAHGRWLEAKRRLGPPEQWVQKTKTGYEYANPWLGVMNKAWDHKLKAAAEMGFTPASRSRVHVVDGEEKRSVLEDLLDGESEIKRG
jgi:P27 family predicted phage terminase small subunit